MTDDNLTFRTADPADGAAIGQLVRAAYGRWVPIIGREPRPMLVDYEHAVREHRIDLLIEGEEIVGLIETVLHDDHLWIENVAVSPERQGRGYGRRLLAHGEQLALAAMRHDVRLLTNAAFTSNVELYGRLGYRVSRNEPFMGGITLYMSKTLA